MASPEIVLCHPVRTAIGTYNGSLKGTPATELGATAVLQTTRLIHAMRGDGLERGIATLCMDAVSPVHS